MSGEKFIFSIEDGTVKLCGGDQVLRTFHLNPGPPKPRTRTRKPPRRIRRIFFNPTSRLIVAWWWSWGWFLVHSRQFYSPSSRRTQGQTVRADWSGHDGCVRYWPSKNQNKGSTNQPERWWIRFPIRRWNSKIVRKRLRIPSTHSKAVATCKEWRSQWRNSRWIGWGSTGRTYKWRWSPGRFLVDPRWLSSTVITVNHNYNSMCRRKKHTPFHFNTLMLHHTGLEIMQERKIDDYWNVDSCKPLSVFWRGFTKIHFIEREPPKGYMWSRERLTKIQTTIRPDHVWPEFWMKIGKAAQNREKQEWAKKKSKLDNARKLRGIYFIDPDDKEYSEILKNARRNL